MIGFQNALLSELVPGKELTVRLTAVLIYVDAKGRRFTVPKGFECDLASVPRFLRSIATPWHQSARAGVLHDCGVRWFEVWKIPRAEMDELYRQALRDDGVSWFRAWMQKRGVRLGGWRAWNRWRKTLPIDKGKRPTRWRAAA